MTMMFNSKLFSTNRTNGPIPMGEIHKSIIELSGTIDMISLLSKSVYNQSLMRFELDPSGLLQEFPILWNSITSQLSPDFGFMFL